MDPLTERRRSLPACAAGGLFLWACCLPACRGTPDAVVETTEGRVLAYGGQDPGPVADTLEAIGPRVREVMGTTRRPPVVRIGVHPPFGIGATTQTEILIRDGEDVREVTTHELVHWYAVDAWRRLPPGVEDGMAYALGMRFTGKLRLGIDPPEWEDLDSVLQPDLNVWMRVVGPATVDAALWVVAKTGFERLAQLCRRAEAEGHECFPPVWFLEHLDARPYRLGKLHRITWFDASGREIESVVANGRDQPPRPPDAVRSSSHPLRPFAEARIPVIDSP